MDRFLEAVASILGLKSRRRKRIEKGRRGIALNLNSSVTNELTVHETPNEKKRKLKDEGKLFVGGLNYATTSEELSAYFSKFGDVINGVVIKCPTSGKSRGFGFVSFLNPADAEKALQNKYHVLHGRAIECLPSDSKDDSTEIKPKNINKARVFLGGLPDCVTNTELEQFFSRYGKLLSVHVPVDWKTKKRKGFAFISFENEDAAEKCVAERFVYLKGRRIFMNKAEPRNGGPRAGNRISQPHGSALTDPDSCTEYTEDSASLPDDDTQSSSSGQLNFEFEQHPEFQQLFQNYFAKKLNHYSEMSKRNSGSGIHQFQNCEINALENFFREMSVNSRWDLDQDTDSESSDSDASDKSYEENCENLAYFLLPQLSSSETSPENSAGKSTSKVILPFEKNEKEKPDLKFSTQDVAEGRLHTPMNFKNNTGTLSCAVCQWIPPDQSFEALLSHLKTAAHKKKLVERFQESQMQGIKVEPKEYVNNEKQKDSLSKANFYPKVTGSHPDESQRQNNTQNLEWEKYLNTKQEYFKLLEQSLPQQVIKEEVKKVEKAKKKKQKKKKQNHEQMTLNSAQGTKVNGVPNSENKKQVSKSEKQNSHQQTKDPKASSLNLKFYALAKGMASVQAESEKSLICETCNKQIPSSTNFDLLMKNLLMHLQSKKHLQKLVKTEDKLKSLLLEIPEPGDSNSLDKKIKSPKDQNILSANTASLVQEKESKNANPKNVDVKTQKSAAPEQKKDKTNDLGVKFLCLHCNFSNSTFEEFGRHLESERHLNTPTPDGAFRAKIPECTECNSCNAFLFGSLFEINLHFSTCSKKKG